MRFVHVKCVHCPGACSDNKVATIFLLLFLLIPWSHTFPPSYPVNPICHIIFQFNFNLILIIIFLMKCVLNCLKWCTEKWWCHIRMALINLTNVCNDLPFCWQTMRKILITFSMSEESISGVKYTGAAIIHRWHRDFFQHVRKQKWSAWILTWN